MFPSNHGIRSTIHSAAFAKAGVSKQNRKDKRFWGKRKHWDTPLYRHNKTNKKTIAGMSTSHRIQVYEERHGCVVTIKHSTGKALKLFLLKLQRRCSTCFRLFDPTEDGALWNMGEFAFDHWPPW
jgi:hypothetical protein